MFDKKALRRLILPLVFEQLLTVMIGMVDVFMVSHLGETAVAGVSNVDSINVLINSMFAALATGGAIVCSQYIGRNQPEQSQSSAKQLIITVAVISAVISVLGFIFNTQLLSLIFGDVEEALMTYSKTYFYMSVLSYPSIALYNCGAALFRAMGNSRVSLFCALVMNIVHIALNAFFIYGLNLGVFGAGLATLISRTTVAVLILMLLRRKELPVNINGLFKTKIDLKTIGRILGIGIPSGFENSLFQLGKLILQGLVTSFGTAAIAANAVTGSIANIANIPGAALGLAMITVVGQEMGAERRDEAKMYTKKLMKMSYASMVVTNLAIFLLAAPLVSLFNLSEEASSTAVIMIMLHSTAAAIIWPASFTLPNAFRAAGDVKFTMIVAVLSMWFARIGLAYFFGNTLELGVVGVWLAMFCDWAVRVAVFVPHFISGKWLGKKVI